MQITKAKKEDHAILSDITYKGKAFWGYEKSQLEKWKTDLTISEEYIVQNSTFKLIVEGKIIGYYAVLKVQNDIWELDNIFVLPECIGKGYGKLLLLDCINKAKTNHIKKIILNAEPQAEGFYKNFGFETYNHLESSIKDRFLPKMMLTLI